MRRNTPRLAAFGLFAIAVFANAAASAAPDAHAVADALVAAFGATGKAAASYGDATASGDTVTITGFKATEPKRTGRDIAIQSIVLAGVAPRQPGGFTATSMTMSDGSATYRKELVKWQTAVLQDAVIPTPDEVRSISKKVQPFSKASVTGATLSAPELSQPIDIAKADLAMSADANGEPNSVTFSTAGVHVPASAFSSPDVSSVMQSLGYTDLVLSVGFDAGFDAAADTFTLRSFDLDIADVGKLAITGKFSHVKVHGMVNTSADGKPAPKQVPNLDSLTVRFDNAGVIERALDMQAQIIGTTREDMANQWPMLLMLFMGGTGNVAFENKLQQDLTTFLHTPKSFTVTLSPPAPVPLDKVARTLAHDQGKLPDLLAADIAVNQ